MHRLIFFITSLIVYSSIFFYFKNRYVGNLKVSVKTKRFLDFFLFLLVILPILSFIIFVVQGRTFMFIASGAFFLFGIIFTLLPYSFFRDILFFIYGRYRKFTGGPTRENIPLDALSRREFLNKSNMALLSLTGFSVGYGYREATTGPTVIRHEVPIAGLPAEFEGLKIVQISDVHIGYALRGEFLLKIVSLVNSQKPDLVAITGDLVDGRVRDLKKDISLLGKLESTYGSFFCTGNHEYYSGVNEWIKELDSLGINVLMNSHRKISSGKSELIIAGVPDHREGPVNGHPYDPKGAVKNVPGDKVKILLAHQPVDLEKSLEAGYHLQLSGHTHGGQFFPWNIAVNFIYKYSAGLHQHKNKMWINVNRGTGYWGPPIRLGVPSEITLLILKAG